MSHEKIANRLAMILMKLNEGLTLDVKELANEFSVNVRTIQRDLNERFAYLQLVKNDSGNYTLDPMFIRKLQAKDIDEFAKISGIRDLFPEYAKQWVLRVQKSIYKDAYRVMSHHYEESTDSCIFRTLEKVIIENRVINFRYKDKKYSSIKPYKLINYAGIWYLSAVDGEKLKSFHVSKIGRIKEESNSFVPDPNNVQLVNQSESIWFTKSVQKAKLIVNASVSSYFNRRQLFEGQKLLEILPEDQSSVYEVDVYDETPFLSRVSYWMPNVSILEPMELKERHLEMISRYLKAEKF